MDEIVLKKLENSKILIESAEDLNQILVELQKYFEFFRNTGLKEKYIYVGEGIFEREDGFIVFSREYDSADEFLNSIVSDFNETMEKELETKESVTLNFSSIKIVFVHRETIIFFMYDHGEFKISFEHNGLSNYFLNELKDV